MEPNATPPKHEASSDDKDAHNTSYESKPEEPVEGLKSEASGGEVMSLKDCCREAFAKITEYLNGELAGELDLCHKIRSDGTKFAVYVS